MAEHHKTHKYTASEKSGSKQKKAQIKEGQTTSSSDDWHLPLLGFDLCLDCKEKITIHQLKKKGKDTVTAMNYCKIEERRRKEALPFSLSLQILKWSFVYYRYAQMVLRETGV